MKKFLILVGIVVAVLNSAWIAEGTSNNCAAYESWAMKKAIRTSDTNSAAKSIGAGMAVALMRQSNGAFAAAIAAEKVPQLPTSVSCNLVYWYATLGGIEPPKS
jgi:hypothetical protein